MKRPRAPSEVSNIEDENNVSSESDRSSPQLRSPSIHDTEGVKSQGSGESQGPVESRGPEQRKPNSSRYVFKPQYLIDFPWLRLDRGTGILSCMYHGCTMYPAFILYN